MVAQHYRWDFIGLSTDTKPTPETSEKVVNGSTFYCSDTSKLYVYCDGTWYQRKALGGGGGGGTSDYPDLTNKPKINNVELNGNKTSSDLGLQPAGNYALESDIENLQEELKRNLQTTTGSGEEVTLEKTAELEFVKPPLPRGNIVQDGEPTPDNPQEVEVVTGNVGVTISNENNTESKTLPVSLGNIELCKIGNYQDYLYKNNGKWYKYGAIGKLTITSIASVGTSSTGIKYALVRSVTVASPDSFIYCSNYANATSASNNNTIRFSGTNLYVYDNRLTDYTTASNLLNGLEYYCVLATPTITEITDTTLISQLEEISKTLSYQGQTNIASNTIALFDVEAYQSTKLVLEDLDLTKLSTFDSTKTQVLKNVNGTLTWADE